MADREERSRGKQTAERYVQALDEVSTLGDLPDRSIFDGPYRRLFTAQCVSSFGDWLGFLAVVSLAGAATKSNKDVAVGVVLSARLIPGFFFGAFATSVLYRWDRKRLLVVCDIGRGSVYALIPFVHSVAGLFAASLLLELLTLMWTPAKEASVPNLVSPDQLAAANSASLTAAYGTIIAAVLLFPVLTFVAGVLSGVDGLAFLKTSTSLPIYVDVVSFFASAALISRLVLPRKTAQQKAAIAASTLGSTWRDAKDGWKFIGQTHRVRAVIIGFCTALIGGGMTVPLATTYATVILHKSATGFGLLALALGLGVALGVLLLPIWQRRLSPERTFVLAVFVAGASLIFAASMSNIGLVMVGIGSLGMCAGAVYVLGFTILGQSTSDEFRGRIFGVFYTLVRLCLLLAFALAPAISAILGGLTFHFQRTVKGKIIHHEIGNARFHVAVPGTRLTLILGGLIILAASWMAHRDLRRADAPEGDGDA